VMLHGEMLVGVGVSFGFYISDLHLCHVFGVTRISESAVALYI